MQDSEDSLRLALLIERLATVARDAGAKPEAALDVARRVVTDHAGEMLTGGVIRLGSGASVHDAIESTRIDMPEYWCPATEAEPTPPAPPPAATTTTARRKRASDRLSRANGDAAPRLNPGPRRKPGEAA
ncbi:hypothetical protein [Brevundimonas sp.]|uniref:hypothetical protein n=1 Tax=Brevundimonas sp. TaxID=1871086 RepID=UPI0035AE0E00